MENIAPEVPEDVKRTLARKAAYQGQDPEQYRAEMLANFVKILKEAPYFQLQEAKLGWDLERVAITIMTDIARSLDQTDTSFYHTATPDEWSAALNRLGSTLDPNRPPLPEEAFHRESFYGDRG